MKIKYVLVISLLINCVSAVAQDIMDISKKMSFHNDLPIPRFIIKLPDTTYGISLRPEDLKSITKEKLAIVKNVDYVELCFANQIELNLLVKELANYKNLKYLSFSQSYGAKITTDSIIVPKELSSYENLVGIKFAGKWKMNYKESLLVLASLPKLEFFLFENISQNIPDGLLSFKNLKGLSIHNDNSIEFPAWISNLQELESISLGFSQYKNKGPNFPNFSNIFRKLVQLPKLKGLYVNNLYNLNDKYDDIIFKKLEILKISGGKPANIGDFFKFLSNHKKLSSLDLSQLYLDTLKNNLSKLKELKSLSIDGSNKPLKIEFELKKLKKLQALKLRFFSSIPQDIEFPESLIKLDLSSNKLSVLPSNITMLRHLESLELIYNSLVALPNNLDNLKKIKGLNLSNNLITSLPNNIGDLSSLKNLYLMANPLKELPESIGNLQNLKLLDLTYCDISNLPQSFGELKNLEVIKLESNFLIYLPNSFTKLINLEYANLNSNDILVLPNDLGSLQNLKVLNLRFNKISFLPSTVGRLKKLEELNLSFNNLNALPEELSDLVALKKLEMTNGDGVKRNSYNPREIFRKDNPNPKFISGKNNIEYLPKDLSKWSNLISIEMSNNNALKEMELFNSLLTVSAKSFTINLENANITSLPSNGWANFNVGVLNLKGNNLMSIPPDIVNAPYLFSYNFNENRLPSKPINFNSYTANKYEKLIGFKEFGFITAKELPQVDSMALAYAEKSNNHYYRNEYAKTVEYAELAKLINKDIADAKIFKNNLGESKYQIGDYKGAIEDLTIAIKRDTAGNVKIMNFVQPDFDYRAKSYLKIGDTLSAIKDYETLALNHWSDTWAEVGILHRQTGNYIKANDAFDKGVSEYQEYIVYGKKQKIDVELKQLSLLEVLIVSENFNAAEKYAEEINTEIKNKANTTLLAYLAACAKIGNNKEKEVELKVLNEIILANKKSITSWGYELFYKWLRVTKIAKPKTNLIRMLTDNIKPSYN